jgi:F1F0 ATPase subunit 2
MDAREAPMIAPDLTLVRDTALGFFGGFLVGLFHFSSLWWNTRLLVAERAGKAIVLQVARLAVTATTLAILTWLGPLALVGAGLGLFVARGLAVQRFGESR